MAEQPGAVTQQSDQAHKQEQVIAKVDDNTQMEPGEEITEGESDNNQKSMPQTPINDYFKDFDDNVYKHGNTNQILRCIKSYSTIYKYSSVYGAYCIQSNLLQKYSWNFKIKIENIEATNSNDIKQACGTYIGISSTYICDEDCFANTESNNYGTALYGDKWSKKKHENFKEIREMKFNNGDLFGMKLDLIKKELSYSHNGKHLGVAWTNIDVDKDIQYKLAVLISHAGTILELVDFKIGQDVDVCPYDFFFFFWFFC